jgi:mediator of RNA polymerase II transcription subunit 14
MPGLLIDQVLVMDLPQLNGTQQPLPNGIPAKPVIEQNGGHIAGGANGAMRGQDDGERENGHFANSTTQNKKENGASDSQADRLDGLPIEIKQLTQHFRPFHSLIHRSVQQTWNKFSDLIDQLSEMSIVPSENALNASYGKPQVNGADLGDQSQANLEKKDRLLKFQHAERALYIKFLTLHDWYQKSRGIDQVIEISMWMHEQRAHFTQAADFLGNMKRELALWQLPNPDLNTATEILSKGRVSALSDLGYVTAKPLSARGMLRTLQDINILLCTRLSLHDQVPAPLSRYRIHDGRATFIVRHEFELDLSVADEDPSSQFYFIDFRYLFLQHPITLSGRLHDDLAAKINDVLRRDSLLGCYNFLHDLTLSHKLNSLRRQALDMGRKQWSESLRVELINRTLVVQYWLNRPTPKSWIEIGVKSGRRKKRRDLLRSTEPYLDLRWIPEKKGNHDFQVDFDLSPLSIENILRGAISRHSSSILDRFYQKLLEFKMYADGQKRLELFSSNVEASDCSLVIQLTSTEHITLSVEPISGLLILQPASSISGRTEFEINRLQNPVEDGLQHISMLRCLAAEQEFTQYANIAGWEVLQTFRLSQRELRALFPSDILRHMLIRQASWQQNAMVAATFGMESDNWWLIYSAQQDLVGGPTNLVAQRIDCANLQEQHKMDSVPFFSQLKEYASGAIAFKVAEQELRQQKGRYEFDGLPALQEGGKLPLMKVKYVLADVKRALKPSLVDVEIKNSQKNRKDKLDDEESDHPSWIQPSVGLRFCGLHKTTHNALLLAKGRSTASTIVLECLKPLAGSGFKVNSETGEFLASFQVAVGNSIISELFTFLYNFDSLLSCLSIVKSFHSMRIQSLSMSQIAIEYDRQAELSTSIKFPSSDSSVAIRLLPEGNNPHSLISDLIAKLLADLRRPFTANLGGVLTMLTITQPLLTLFDELVKLHTPTNAAAENYTAFTSSTVRLHVIARSPAHYALQYFVPSTDSRTMIARFEIFRHIRRDTPVWILRPALEETFAYSRSSFIDIALKQRLTDEVFNVRGATGWLGLDTGASCPIDSPGSLVRRVDDVVQTWSKESLKDVLGEAKRLEMSSKDEMGGVVTEPVAIPSHLGKPTHHQQSNQPQNQQPSQQQRQHPQQPNQQQNPQQQRPGGGGSRPAANGTNQSRQAMNTQRPAPAQRQQGAKDVITLD